MDIRLESVFSLSYQKGESVRRFSYVNHELIYFYSGRGEICINDKVYNYLPGSVLLTQNTDVKDYDVFCRTEYTCIRFASSKFIQKFRSGVYALKEQNIYQLFKSIKREYAEKRVSYYELCNMKTAEILVELSRNSVQDNKDGDIYTLIKEIDSTMLFQKSITDIAGELNYNYDYLRQKFKKITGVSLKSYIMQQRLQNACSLLEQGNYSCTEIAQLCGFSSSSQFSRIFKEKMGYPPKTYKLDIERGQIGETFIGEDK